jgi:peptidoglycan/xylan/chitin deacetylase (PgdA/CDA1 family)
MIFLIIALLVIAYIVGWFIYTKITLKTAPLNRLAMHDIGDNFDLSISRVSTRSLDNLLRHLAQTSRRGVSLSESDQPNTVALTFDDGLENFYDLAFPILQRYGFTATVFLVSDYIGQQTTWDYHKRNHLNWQQIAELAAAGIEFGSHSATHQDLRALDDEELQYELFGSKTFLESKLGRPVKYVSYPFGRYNERVIQFSRKAGFVNGFGLARGEGDFVLPRACVYLYDTPYSIEKKLGGSWIETCKDHINNSLAGGTIILKKLIPEKS